jgi:PIN domain nuclease of toxin-antitoxin system
MTYLLDTHCFLWSLFSPEKLTRPARDLIADATSSVAVSSVSFWEIALKSALGKLELENVSPTDLPAAARRMKFELLSLDPQTAAGAGRLPRERHKDPFDRMLIWQAISHDLVLVSRDRELPGYASFGLKTLR